MTREEAIEKVRKMSLSKETMEILQALAPELKESDDERVRKNLVEYHRQQFEKNRDQEIGLFHKDVLAYLEKQKEPQYTKRNALFDKCVENCDPEIMKKVSDEIDALLQKEQKEIPLMNGDADLYFDNWIQHNDTTKRGCFEEGIRYAQRLQKEQFTHHEAEESLIEAVNHQMEDDGNVYDFVIRGIDDIALKYAELGAKWQKEQKPAEWSEEDEEILDGIINTLDRLGYAEFCKSSREEDIEEERFYYKEIQCLKKLKSLRPQSPKDYMKQLAIGFIHYLDKHRPEDKMCVSNGECADIEKAFVNMEWGKIIRYANKYLSHWKPSEEQMEVLLNAEGLVRANNYPENAKILAALYEQLKKLGVKEKPEYYQHFDPDC